MFGNVLHLQGRLAEIRESARWSPGKITTKANHLGQNRDRRNMSTHLADLSVWLALGVWTFRTQQRPCDPSGHDSSAFSTANSFWTSSSVFHTRGVTRIA